MSEKVLYTPAVISYAPKENGAGAEAEIVDRAGNAILGLVGRAADTAAADLREAREVAEKLADQLRAANEQLQAAHDQLRAAHGQINDLKADIGHYQDRANRAEKWLQQISSEIEQRFFDATRRQPRIQAQGEKTARSVTPPVEELITDETHKIAAKFAPYFLRAKRH
jgi:DNA repair exonuclease SbcCD ATPase subunit